MSRATTPTPPSTANAQAKPNAPAARASLGDSRRTAGSPIHGPSRPRPTCSSVCGGLARTSNPAVSRTCPIVPGSMSSGPWGNAGRNAELLTTGSSTTRSATAGPIPPWPVSAISPPQAPLIAGLVPSSCCALASTRPADTREPPADSHRCDAETDRSWVVQQAVIAAGREPTEGRKRPRLRHPCGWEAKRAVLGGIAAGQSSPQRHTACSVHNNGHLAPFNSRAHLGGRRRAMSLENRSEASR